MTELPIAPRVFVPSRRSRWRVAAWITLATNAALLALDVFIALLAVHPQDSSAPVRDDGLASLALILLLGVPAVGLAAVAVLALTSILSGDRSAMIAATIVGVLVTTPIAALAGWWLYSALTMPDY